MKNSAYLTLFCVCTVAQAASLVDPLYCSGMVVQREAPISVRGNGDFGQTVVARFANQEKAATVSTDGRWEVDLAPLPAGGPYELLVRSGKEEVRLNDVWVGDVWIASGQSNMELTLKDSTGGAEAAARPPEGTLRLWNVDKIVAHAPRDILQSAWKPGMAEAALNSSGVGYYFGRLLAERTNIPIGMVNASWGGTPIQSWTRTEVLPQEAPQQSGQEDREDGPRQHHAGSREAVAGASLSKAPPARWTRRRGFFCGTRLRLVHPGASSDVQQERR